ncbi:hypothetical protein NE237_020725 [Protea cynaroides]|uniref:Uncharacterized protein n=1 Tax=Protea cynaroides TaxID=273540 RepID=A0A9Q0K3Q0_9MAGN|nr:hypothetical protein NE237_020725 [Protea cynaroides]
MMMALTSMDACFLNKPKSFPIKTLEIIPSIKPRISIFSNNTRKKRSSLSCCHLGSPVPEDDSKPSMDADWRSFRARLVAGELASRPEDPVAGEDNLSPPDTVGDKWAHPLHEPERGCLLIATDKLDGVHIFERTVILVLSMGPVGPTGIIMNRPSLMSIKETRSTALDVAGIFSDMPLFFGGPVEEGLFLVGPEPKKGTEDGVEKSGVFEEVMKGLYYGTKESVGCAGEMVKRKVVKAGDFRFFDGCCGWEKDQLKGEIRAGYWRVAACSPTVIGVNAVGTAELWEEILGLMDQRKVR